MLRYRDDSLQSWGCREPASVPARMCSYNARGGEPHPSAAVQFLQGPTQSLNCQGHDWPPAVSPPARCARAAPVVRDPVWQPGVSLDPLSLAAQLRFCFECPPRLSPRRSGFTRLNQDGDSAWSDRVHNSRRDPLPRAVTYHLSMSYCRGIYNFWGMSCRPRHGMPPPQNAAVVHNLIHPRES